MKKVSEALDKNNNIVICPEDLKGYNHVAVFHHTKASR